MASLISHWSARTYGSEKVHYILSQYIISEKTYYNMSHVMPSIPIPGLIQRWWRGCGTVTMASLISHWSARTYGSDKAHYIISQYIISEKTYYNMSHVMPLSRDAIHPHPWADPTLVEGLRQPPVLGLWPGKAKGRIWTEPWNLKTTHIWKSDLGIRINPSEKYAFFSWYSYS